MFFAGTLFYVTAFFFIVAYNCAVLSLAHSGTEASQYHDYRLQHLSLNNEQLSSQWYTLHHFIIHQAFGSC